MKRKITSLLITGLVLGTTVFGAAVPAYAGTYTYTDTGLFDSNGSPTQDSSSTATTSIDVSAHVEGGPAIIYSVQIEWGAMQFEYDYGSKWNPATHTYVAGNSGSRNGGWVASHLDGSNDKITVTNDSNYPISATFTYSDSSHALNPNGTSTNTVTGIFDSSETRLKGYVSANSNTSSLTTDQTNPTRYIDMCTSGLDAGDTYYKYNGTVGNAGGYVDNLYFSLIGEPDPGLSMSTGVYTASGTVKVDIAPVPAGSVSSATKE